MSQDADTVAMPPPPIPRASISDPPPPATSYTHDWAFIRKTLKKKSLRRIVIHQMPETAWNLHVRDVLNCVIQDRGDPTNMELEIVMGNSLYGAVTQPGGVAFHDVPVQKHLAALVVKRRLKVDNITAEQLESNRNSVGSYIPDILNKLQHGGPDAEELTSIEMVLLALMMELKVTEIAYNRQGKPIARTRPEDNPDLFDDVDDISSVSTFYSVDTVKGGKEVSTVIQIDGVAKWRCGLAKQIVYQMLGDQYCGAYLGAAVIGTRYSRIILQRSGDDHIIVLEEKPGRANPESVMTMEEYIKDDSNADRLVWDLAAPSPQPGQHDWNESAVGIILDFALLSVNLLEDAVTNGDLSVIRRADHLSPTLSTICKLSRKPTDVTNAALHSRYFAKTFRDKHRDDDGSLLQNADAGDEDAQEEEEDDEDDEGGGGDDDSHNNDNDDNDASSDDANDDGDDPRDKDYRYSGNIDNGGAAGSSRRTRRRPDSEDDDPPAKRTKDPSHASKFELQQDQSDKFKSKLVDKWRKGVRSPVPSPAPEEHEALQSDWETSGTSNVGSSPTLFRERFDLDITEFSPDNFDTFWIERESDTKLHQPRVHDYIQLIEERGVIVKLVSPEMMTAIVHEMITNL